MDKFISYAQNCEDVILWRALRGIPSGRYMDIGANHPLNDSVTKAFYDRGWRGINVEPIRSLCDLLLAERPQDINLCCAVSSRPGTTKFYEVDEASGLSTLDTEIAESHAQSGRNVRAYDVAVETISSICALHDIDNVHFLKIDVEGAELAVLEGMPFDRLKPWIIVVEATKPNTQTPSHQSWEPMLLSHGYSFVYFDGANRYYLHVGHQELSHAFDAPPNAFDNYIQYPVYRQLMDELDFVRAESAAYKKRLDSIRASMSWKLTKPLRGIHHILSMASGKLKRLLHV